MLELPRVAVYGMQSLLTFTRWIYACVKVVPS